MGDELIVDVFIEWRKIFREAKVQGVPFQWRSSHSLVSILSSHSTFTQSELIINE